MDSSNLGIPSLWRDFLRSVNEEKAALWSCSARLTGKRTSGERDSSPSEHLHGG